MNNINGRESETEWLSVFIGVYPRPEMDFRASH